MITLGGLHFAESSCHGLDWKSHKVVQESAALRALTDNRKFMTGFANYAYFHYYRIIWKTSPAFDVEKELNEGRARVVPPSEPRQIRTAGTKYCVNKTVRRSRNFNRT
ncbi:hypothetical protein Trydic_g21159 [Trypoxylus dichotomus]